MKYFILNEIIHNSGNYESIKMEDHIVEIAGQGLLRDYCFIKV